MRPLGILIAIVTGAGSGIGKAIALRLAREGATVAAVDKNIGSLNALLKEAEGMSHRLIPFGADLENDRQIRELVAGLGRAFEGIDILVHSAGVISLGNIEETAEDSFDRQFRINLRAPFLLTRALLPSLRSRKGQIVFINSSSGLRAKAGTAAYSASKHALKAVADALRDEVNRDGVRVVSVYPGRTATAMQEEIAGIEGFPFAPEDLLQADDVAQVVCHALGLNRTAEITDIQIRPAKKTR
jgi:NAD(P)-dependent dehydrogenase (short-subunit alcohol dehydrogenase family)